MLPVSTKIREASLQSTTNVIAIHHGDTLLRFFLELINGHSVGYLTDEFFCVGKSCSLYWKAELETRGLEMSLSLPKWSSHAYAKEFWNIGLTFSSCLETQGHQRLWVSRGKLLRKLWLFDSGTESGYPMRVFIGERMLLAFMLRPWISGISPSPKFKLFVPAPLSSILLFIDQMP